MSYPVVSGRIRRLALYTSETADAMTEQQTTSVVVLLLGVAALIISAGVTWILSRISRTRRVEGTSVITVVSFLLFVVGIVLCWFGVSAIVEGGR
jgi:flagellar biogenesis protein FliO